MEAAERRSAVSTKNAQSPMSASSRHTAGHNELLVGRALTARRDGVVLATKFGLTFEGGRGRRRRLGRERSALDRHEPGAPGRQHVELTPGELARLDVPAPKGAAAGDRWTPELMEQLDR